MSTKTAEREPIAAAEEELPRLAELRQLTRDRSADELRLVGSGGEEAPLTEAALFVFRQVLDVLAENRAVVISGMAKDLSVEQAATFLNMTRVGLIDLLDRGLLPSHEPQGLRRIGLDDLIAYKRGLEAERENALQRLADQSQAIAQLLD